MSRGNGLFDVSKTLDFICHKVDPASQAKIPRFTSAESSSQAAEAGNRFNVVHFALAVAGLVHGIRSWYWPQSRLVRRPLRC